MPWLDLGQTGRIRLGGSCGFGPDLGKVRDSDRQGRGAKKASAMMVDFLGGRGAVHDESSG